MYGFDHFNYILLSLFDITNVFQDNILTNIKADICHTV